MSVGGFSTGRDAYDAAGRPSGGYGAVGGGGGPEAAAERPSLASGSKGPDVRRLQEALQALGADLKPDGGYGPKTIAAVKALQQKHGLSADGRVGAKTWAAIDAGLAATRPAPAAAPPVDLMAAIRASVGNPPSPAIHSHPSQPSAPTYDNWFTDADKLEAPADVRRYLDQALRTGSNSDIRALRAIDVNMASVAEKASLLAKLTENGLGSGDAEWALQLLQRKPDEAGPILHALYTKGRLAPFLEGFDGDTRSRLLAQLPSFVATPQQASEVVGSLLRTDSKENRLGAHWVFDKARAGGFLDAALADLKRAHGASKVVNELIAQAKPTIRPAVIAHRGGPPEYVENTMPAIKAAVEGGAEAVEIDVTVTADNEIVLWHDFEESGIVATMRASGMEPGTQYKPVWPVDGGSVGKAVHEMKLDAVRGNLGYSARDGNVFTNEKVRGVEIPTFNQVADYAKKHPELKTIYLDIKLPTDNPGVQDRFATKLKQILAESGLGDRVICLHNDSGTVSNLKRTLGDKIAFSHDVEIVSLAPSADSYSAVRSANRLGNRVASVGRPRLGIDAYDTYKEVLTRDRAALKTAAHPQKLITWTINDELEMRELIAIGVDGIMTDQQTLLQKLNRAYGFDR